MKQILLSLLFISSNALASNPTPKIFAVVNGVYTATNAISGEVPFVLSVSAIPPVSAHPCFWDPTAWHNDGEHNLCDLDKASVSTKNPANLSKYFSTNSASLSHPQSVESSNPSACFVPPFDTASMNLNNAISSCIRSRDLSMNADASKNLLGGGTVYKTDFKWDFGSANEPYNAVPGLSAAHLYEKVGKYLMTLSVKNELGGVGLLTIVVTINPSTRATVNVNNDADMQLLQKAKPGRRAINFKAGATLHSTGTIPLFSGDWINGQGATLINNHGAVFSGSGDQIVVEKLSIQAPGQVVSSVKGTNVAFKSIPFSAWKGFDTAGTGHLYQSVGTPPINGTWQSNHLQSNWILGTLTGASLYGNFGYEAKEDWSSEPQIRFNGGELISLFDNDIGGFCGKQNCLSFRGSKNVYLGHNRVYGGVTNIQGGTSQNPQVAVLPINWVIEGNDIQNVNLQVQSPAYGVRYNSNSMIIHNYGDAFNNSYPFQNPIGFSAQAGPLWGLTTDQIVVTNSIFNNYNPVKKIFIIDSGVKNVSQSNNSVINH